MKTFLSIMGAAALLAWTGLGLLAWQSVAQRVTIVSSDEPAHPEGPSEVAVLGDRVETLHADVRALAQALNASLAGLHEELLASQAEHAAAIERRMDSLRGEVTSRTAPSSPDGLDDLLREVAAIREQLSSPGSRSDAAESAVQSVPIASAPEQPVELVVVPAATPEPAAPPSPEPEAPAAKPRKSFLAFTLPSDDLRFDERRSWTLLPALSRVGFDAKTTLHDFTATTSALEGSLEAELARPALQPRARMVARAAELASGDGGRDAEMRERLAVEAHPTIEFELLAFEPSEIDATAMKAAGTARGRMTIRGVSQEVEMPVRIAIDEARRLTVEGQMPLDLEAYGVPVPNKLGLISMQKEVQVWISLKFRAAPRSEG